MGCEEGERVRGGRGGYHSVVRRFQTCVASYQVYLLESSHVSMHTV